MGAGSSTVAVGSDDGLVIFDLTTRLNTTLAGPDEPMGITWSVDSQKLLVWHYENLWEVSRDGQVIRHVELGDRLVAIAFSPNNKYVAVAGGRADPTIEVWRLDS